ncbi:hypothetical protein MLD38_015911 [Melastoma candidum]|uniref:Uncharacterized protein n=1 Tax=Melastoma candidum TaxID=119954 RepID=A0ACB9RJL4_9MYRT|nr:hypothetical protein MLD38_015911 [Melastoma candidum]
MSRPYIRQEFLQEKFGDSWPLIASNFFMSMKNNYTSSRRNATQRKKVAAKLKSFTEKSFLGSGDKNKALSLRLVAGVHVTLESLTKDKGLKSTIKDLVQGSGRSCPTVAVEIEDLLPEKQPVLSRSSGQGLGGQLNGASTREALVVS